MSEMLQLILLAGSAGACLWLGIALAIGTPFNDVSDGLRKMRDALRDLAEALESEEVNASPSEPDSPPAVQIGEIKALLSTQFAEYERRQGRTAWMQGAFWFFLGVATTALLAVAG